MNSVLLSFIPVSLALRYLLDVQPIWVFVAGAAAIGVLADWLRRATEQLGHRAGATIGGLLNVSFGNIAELVLALFVLSEAETQVVQAQITGSIIGTTQLFLGISAWVGGIGRTRQTFNQVSVGLLSTLLFLVVVAILLPAVFDLTERTTAPGAQISPIDEHLSLSVSVVLLVIYVANLAYTLVTHRDVFATDSPRGEAEWSLTRALAVMTIGTVLIAIEAELVSAALEGPRSSSGYRLSSWVSSCWPWSVVFAMCVGSAIQIALVVAPVLVLTSWMIGRPMNLVFGSPLDLFAIASTAFIVRAIAADGETTWFEGLLLVGVYVLFALAFYFQSPI
jgi:Ca2+:H+ antiporter